MKGYRIYIALLAGSFIFFVVMQSSRPQPVDWSPSFLAEDAIPYGTLVLRDMLDDMFPDTRVSRSNQPFSTYPDNQFSGTSLLVINDEFSPDSYDTDWLIGYVKRGNTLFVAASTISGPLADSLGIHVERTGLLLNTTSSEHNDSTTVRLVNRALASAHNRYRRTMVTSHLSIDTLAERITVLAVGRDSLITFARIPLGEGNVLVSTLPYLYTNYAILHNRGEQFVAASLGYLPHGEIIYDEYYKSGRRQSTTPLRYILSKTALRWGMWGTLISVVLFMVFMGRRRQRIIPIVKPLANTTLEFVGTMGRLYFNRGNHRNLAEKRILYFLESVRVRYGVNTIVLGDEFIRTVAARSGVPQEEVVKLVATIDRVLVFTSVSAQELLQLNREIELFRSTAGSHGRSTPIT